MSAASIFLDINLPNPTTWFYASGLLAVALFLKFGRLFSIRNLDVLSLFLPMPGLLLLVEAGDPTRAGNEATFFWGYLWLMGVALYFLVRCLVDLALVQRPALNSNLDFSGLAWLACALYFSLVAVAVRDPALAADESAPPASTDTVRVLADKAFQPVAPPNIPLRLWVERGLALLCHLSVVVGLVLIGWRHFGSVGTGMSVATFYLLLPYTYLLLPAAQAGLGRWDHPWCMALLVWAVFCYRTPALAGVFVGLACGSAFFPLVTVPSWFSFYWRRGEGRFALYFLLSGAICVLALILILWLNEGLPTSLRSAWTESDWQPWKPLNTETTGFWQGLVRTNKEDGNREGGISPGPRVSRAPWVYRLPVFVASAALVVMTFFWPSPKNLAHVLALSAACLISVELWYADRGGIHIFWYLPFLLLLIFRPNLVAAQPPPVPSGDYPLLVHWLRRGARHLQARWQAWQQRKPPSSGKQPPLESEAIVPRDPGEGGPG